VLEAEPDNGTIKGFGITFYERLLAQSDANVGSSRSASGRNRARLE
jgi:hypothetical protein